MKIYLLAGEASGDQLGAALMVGLEKLSPGNHFFGVGGSAMEQAGLGSLFPMSDLSVMGLTEVLPRYPALRRRLQETALDVIARKPDVLITIDSPDFSFRLARRVHEKIDIPVIHYVAPSVWAWRQGRAAKMAKVVDHVLALLPFEPPYMTAAGMSCDFVGHPIATVTEPTQADVEAFRQEVGLGSSEYLLALPGSRKSEIARHLPIFRHALEITLASRPDLQVVVPTTADLLSDVSSYTADWPGNPLVVVPDSRNGIDKMACFRGAVAALAASGTVTLELAATGTPTVVAYRTSWLTWQLMSHMAKIDTVTLVNLVTDTRAIPEFLGPSCQPKLIANAIEHLIDDEGARASQVSAMSEAMLALGRGGEDPGTRAARSVLDFLSRTTSGPQ